jgi:uncharacterized protein YuzE
LNTTKIWTFFTLNLKDDKIGESEELEEGIIIDYNKKGEIVGIEIIGLKKKK